MRQIGCEDTLAIIEKLYKLTLLKYEETKENRDLAMYDLSRKMRACMNAILLLPLKEYDVLCVPVNLLYRCMITDFMTALLISVIDDETFVKVMHIMDVEYTKSFQKALKAEIKVRKDVYPDDALDFDKMALEYQVQHYEDFKDCLDSQENEEWKVRSIKKEKVEINKENFSGNVGSIYKVLLTFNEIRDIASIFEYYLYFSQSEHFSLKNRIFNQKQDFHEEYYNKTRGLICLGIEYIIKRRYKKTIGTR